MIITGDNLIVLKTFPDNHFDSVVTDPPYGLGKEPDAEELMKDWLDHGFHEVSGSGFMGKEWDAFVPQPIFWKEVFRVLKPGGHVLAFYGTRTYDWGVMAMRFAGFEIRDQIAWCYGSGFPKSHNISKAIDKLYGAERKISGTRVSAFGDSDESETEDGRNLWGKKSTKVVELKDIAATEEAKQWEGWGSALKPANEPIVLARKPLEKGLSIAENVLKWGVGGINIDGCRVSTENRTYKGMSTNVPDGAGTFRDDNWQPKEIEVTVNGRFPANLILTHHPECECKGLKKVKAIKGGCKFKSAFFKSGESNFTPNGGIGDENGEETVEDWNCHPDCPIKILDEQSGVLKSGKMKQRIEGGQYNVYGKMYPRDVETIGDSGGASRFFYVAKASKSERNKGLEDFEAKQSVGGGGGIGDYLDDVNSASGKYGSEKAPNKNFHPTVKPVKLMQYLVKMITPPNGIVLDPYCGSGTTGIACKLDKFQFVGIEQDAEYSKIAISRIENYVEEIEDMPILNEEENNIVQGSLF